MASESSVSSSSSSSSPKQDTTKPVKPLFSSDPVEYIRIITEVEDGVAHEFIFDKDCAMRYSITIKEMYEMSQRMKEVDSICPSSSSSSGTTLSDDSTLSSSAPESSSSHRVTIHKDPFKFTDTPMQCMEWIAYFMMWKKRWANTVNERIPDFELPPQEDHNLCLQILVANHDLQV